MWFSCRHLWVLFLLRSGWGFISDSSALEGFWAGE